MKPRILGSQSSGSSSSKQERNAIPNDLDTPNLLLLFMYLLRILLHFLIRENNFLSIFLMVTFA